MVFLLLLAVGTVMDCPGGRSLCTRHSLSPGELLGTDKEINNFVSCVLLVYKLKAKVNNLLHALIIFKTTNLYVGSDSAGFSQKAVC